MSYGIVLEFEGVGEDAYWSANKRLGIDTEARTGYPDGLLVHAAGPTASGWIVVEVWDERSSQERFMAERLGAALQAKGLPAPSRVTDSELVNAQALG